MDVIKVLIADDHALIREGLRKILSINSKLKVVGEAPDGNQAVEQALARDVDIILLDINMPGMNGIDACREIKKSKPGIGIIALTIHDQEEYLFEMIRGGISAYLMKDVSPDQLITTIMGVARGESFIQPKLMARVFQEFSRLSNPLHQERKENDLTPREVEVLELVARGESNRGIAQKLFISEKTVKNHLYRIFQKLGVVDRTQAALYAVKHKIVNL